MSSMSWLRGSRAALSALAVAVLVGCAAAPGGGRGDAVVFDAVLLSDVAPQVQQDMRYFGANNFMGRSVAGYGAPQCWLSRPAAGALRAAQEEAASKGLGFLVFDCYRPQRAVDDFVRWGADLSDERTKAQYYPDVPKSQLFERGYIAARSGHSRGSTVDLTLVVHDRAKAAAVVQGPLQEGEAVDMGTPFDWFGIESHTDNAQQPTHVRHNRHWLRDLLARHGWRNLPEEWWHFTLQAEPYPDTYFNQPVRCKLCVDD